MTTTYDITDTARIWSHFPAGQKLFRDGMDDFEDEVRIRARVRSGDYPITLATELSQIAQNMAAAGAPEAAEIERLVSELLYVHKHFEIVGRQL